jgi:hypothetical protein
MGVELAVNQSPLGTVGSIPTATTPSAVASPARQREYRMSSQLRPYLRSSGCVRTHALVLVVGVVPIALINVVPGSVIGETVDIVAGRDSAKVPANSERHPLDVEAEKVLGSAGSDCGARPHAQRHRWAVRTRSSGICSECRLGLDLAVSVMSQLRVGTAVKAGSGFSSLPPRIMCMRACCPSHAQAFRSPTETNRVV